MPTRATADGVLTITDENGERAIHVKPDGTITDGGSTARGSTAMLSAAGELVVDGAVIARVHPDGKLELPAWPRAHFEVRADGAVVRDDEVLLDFGPDGVLRGPLIASGERIVASGDPAARRSLMVIWVGMMAELMSLAPD